MRTVRSLSASLLLALSLGACSQDNPNANAANGALAGSALGAGLGAIVGHQSGHTGGGIAIGAAAGALGGALIGSQGDSANARSRAQDEQIRRQNEEIRRQQREIDEIRRSQGRDSGYSNGPDNGYRYNPPPPPPGRYNDGYYNGYDNSRY